VFVGTPADRRGRAATPRRYGGGWDYRNGPPEFDSPDVGAPDPLLIEKVDELVPALREVRVWALKPTLRELEARGRGVLTRSSLSDMLNGRVPIPPYPRYRAFLEACGIEGLDAWTFTWCRLTKLQEAKVN
jgi:hypothetical protein